MAGRGVTGMTDTLIATLHTNHGQIVVRLFPDHAPKTVRNFVELAEGGKQWTDPRTGTASTDRLYDGTVFHRVIPDFMIQGGAGYQFADEIHPTEDPHPGDKSYDPCRRCVFDRPYLLAMANAGPGTNG